MNEPLPRLPSDPRGPEPSPAVPDMPMVRSTLYSSYFGVAGRADKKAAFSPSLFGASGVGGTRAQRIDAAEAMRRWMFDPTVEQLGPVARDAAAEENQETEVTK